VGTFWSRLHFLHLTPLPHHSSSLRLGAHFAHRTYADTPRAGWSPTTNSPCKKRPAIWTKTSPWAAPIVPCWRTSSRQAIVRCRHLWFALRSHLADLSRTVDRDEVDRQDNSGTIERVEFLSLPRNGGWPPGEPYLLRLVERTTRAPSNARAGTTSSSPSQGTAGGRRGSPTCSTCFGGQPVPSNVRAAATKSSPYQRQDGWRPWEPYLLNLPSLH
jgi:hypothetical protein